MRFLIIFIFLISKSYSYESIEIKNLIINKDLKKYENITFLDTNNKLINLNDYKGNLILLNFWATWCAPCKEEMPSLDSLLENKYLDKLQIFPINIGNENFEKASKFFDEVGIQNLNLYFDPPVTLAKKFNLRGLPTTILIDKKGFEFARIIGSIDFQNKKFVDWLIEYN
mgnify:CR=1 FL=1|tara:strand:- start:751 stop:1260 length:510 start_codon:yes stop_codon:yes gene_type:complete